MTAWQEVQKGKPDPMSTFLAADRTLTHYLSPSAITKLLDVSDHVGDAPERAMTLVKEIRKIL